MDEPVDRVRSNLRRRPSTAEVWTSSGMGTSRPYRRFSVSFFIFFFFNFFLARLKVAKYSVSQTSSLSLYLSLSCTFFFFVYFLHIERCIDYSFVAWFVCVNEEVLRDSFNRKREASRADDNRATVDSYGMSRIWHQHRYCTARSLLYASSPLECYGHTSAYVDLKRTPDAFSSFDVDTVKRSWMWPTLLVQRCLRSKIMEYDSWNSERVKDGRDSTGINCKIFLM